MICCDAPVLRRLLTTLLGGALLVLGTVVPPAQAAPSAPECPPVTVEQSTKAAMAVFSGTVSAIERQPRTDGAPGAIYLQTVTVDQVYQGQIRTETVQVQTDRNRLACSLGSLVQDAEYMFFVTGTGEPWVASGTSGTQPVSADLVTQVEALLGPGEPPIDPPSEQAEFTPVDTSEPQSLARAAAPGAALIIVGLLGLLVVGGVRRRRG